MGQKTNPKGFRLITTQKHLSNWYTNKMNYSKLIQEDYYVRENIPKYFSELLSIAEIEINRITHEQTEKEFVTVIIHALYPRAKEISKKISLLFGEIFGENMENQIQTLLQNSKRNLKPLTRCLLMIKTRQFLRFIQKKTQKTYNLKLKFIKNPFQNAKLIAKYIANQLEKRVPFRRAIKHTIKKVQLASLKGIRIEVSGRLNGAEIARSEWKRDGKIPLHTLRAKMDYTHEGAQTVHGIIGIKVWLFIN